MVNEKNPWAFTRDLDPDKLCITSFELGYLGIKVH
jgi:hypothetical protein